MVDFLGIVLSPVEIADVHDQHVEGLSVHVLLFVYGKGLFEEVVPGVHGDAGNLNSVVVVESVDIVHDAGLVGLDCRNNE